MSRIPKIETVAEKNAFQAKVPVLSQPGIIRSIKRPNDDAVNLLGKKQKTDVFSVPKRKVPSVQPLTTQNRMKPAERLKQVIQPIRENGFSRCSMPAVTSNAFRVPGMSRRPNPAIQMQKLEAKLKSKTEEFEVLLSDKENENDNLRRENQSVNLELTTLQSAYETLQTTYIQETNALKGSITSLTSAKAGIEVQLSAMELMAKNYREEIQHLKSHCSDQENRIESLLKQVSDLQDKMHEEEMLRRKLHNTIQELKGNIRVYCRLRPPLPEEVKNGMNMANIVAVSNKTIEIHQLPDSGINESGGKISKHEFSFDQYFSPSSNQQDIFNEISQLVQSALDGYNVCIFAYGQTGSGKTFTMEGPADIVDFVKNKDNPDVGVIPRSVHQIFMFIKDLEEKDWKYKVETYCLEIYNEKIQDLLNVQNGNTKCEIIKSGIKGTDCILSNVTPSEVTSVEEVYNLLRKAKINRAVAATKCNEYSSRSHYVFQMKIFGENSTTKERCEGTLNLVDLAGSERVKDSESAGDRLTEAKNINKSLSSLGKVIMSLSKKDNHIPYRDSKLTHLLASSLGGSSKTLMFVNISPDNKNLAETINSLRFATKVNQCNIGTAQRKVK